MLFASRSIGIISHFELNVATATHADPAPLARMVDDLDGLSPEDAAAHLTNLRNAKGDVLLNPHLVKAPTTGCPLVLCHLPKRMPMACETLSTQYHVQV